MNEDKMILLKETLRQFTFDCLCEIVLFVMDREDDFFKFQEQLDSEISDMKESEEII